MKKSANRQAWLYKGLHWSFTPIMFLSLQGK